MKPILFWATLLFLALLLPSMAAAQTRIFLNNVDITYVRNQAFENVESVFIDAAGNIIMRAPQYQISEKTDTGLKTAQETYVEPEGTKHPTQDEIHAMTATLPEGKSVYLVANFKYVGLMGYNVDVLINDAFVATLDQNKEQHVLDVTSFLHKGKNVVTYRMVMAASAGRSSRASVEIYYATVTKETDSQVELTGTVAKKVIVGGDEIPSYTIDLFKP